jgi:hypothetical protein
VLHVIVLRKCVSERKKRGGVVSSKLCQTSFLETVRYLVHAYLCNFQMYDYCKGVLKNCQPVTNSSLTLTQLLESSCCRLRLILGKKVHFLPELGPGKPFIFRDAWLDFQNQKWLLQRLFHQIPGKASLKNRALNWPSPTS